MPLLIVLSSILSMALEYEKDEGEQGEAGAGNCWPLPWVTSLSGSLPVLFEPKKEENKREFTWAC